MPPAKTGAQGEKGEKGDKGDTGAAGKDGVNGVDGKDGANGTDGKNGTDGVGISSVRITDQGALTVTLTNGTVLNLGNIRGADGIGITACHVTANGGIGVNLYRWPHGECGPRDRYRRYRYSVCDSVCGRRTAGDPDG